MFCTEECESNQKVQVFIAKDVKIITYNRLYHNDAFHGILEKIYNSRNPHKMGRILKLLALVADEC